MDKKIEVFKNEQFGEIRIALIENEPWFVAVDVCRALEIGNSSQAISRLDADEKMITPISNEGMVDHADFIIAVWDGRPSGTGKTVTYARGRNGKSIIVIDPVTLAIERL